MNPRAMSVWISAAASSAGLPRRSVQARVSVVARGEEAQQVERLEEPRDDPLERRGPVAERCRLLLGELGELGLELEVDRILAGPVHDRDDAASSSAARAPAGARPGSRGASAPRRGARAAPRARRPPGEARRHPTSPASRRARGAARRARGRRRGARARSSRDRVPGRRRRSSRPGRRGARRPPEGRRAAARPVPGHVDDPDRGGRHLACARRPRRSARAARRRSAPCRRSPSRTRSRRR